jgi:hypothetical protein
LRFKKFDVPVNIESPSVFRNVAQVKMVIVVGNIDKYDANNVMINNHETSEFH